MNLRAFGNIFKNLRKTNENQPAYRGSFRVDPVFAKELARRAQNGDVELRYAGWMKQGQNGTFISGNLQFQEEGLPAQNEPQRQRQMSWDEDEIPF